ncbi:MAG: hypothetical protein U0354_18790 [Candidatus Sericytochromatia bacterium]
MYTNYLKDEKIISENILKDLSYESLEVTSIESFLKDKNLKIKDEQIKDFLKVLEKDNKVSFRNKLSFYLRFYNLLDENITTEIKNKFKSNENLYGEYNYNFIKYYNFIPSEDRKELVSIIIKTCKECSLENILILEYDKKNLEKYIYQNHNQEYKYNPDELLTKLYFSLDRDIEDKLFSDIDIKSNQNTISEKMISFIFFNYSKLPHKYINLLDKSISSPNNFIFIDYLSNLKDSDLHLYKKIPIEKINQINYMVFENLVSNKSDSPFKYNFNHVFYYIERYDSLSKEQKKIFKKFLESKKIDSVYPDYIIRTYNKIDKDIKNIIFNKFILNDEKFDIFFSYLSNISFFSDKEIEQIENKIKEKNKFKNFFQAFEYVYRAIPEKYRTKIINQYYKNKDYQTYISSALIKNYEILDKSSKQILLTLLEKNIGLDKAFRHLLNKRINDKLSNYLLKNINKISTESILITLFEVDYSLNDNEKNIILNELVKRNDIKGQYHVDYEEGQEDFIVSEKFEEYRSLFDNDKLIDKILTKIPKTNKNESLSKSFNRFSDFNDSNLPHKQKLEIIDFFIKENKFINSILVLINDKFDSFSDNERNHIIKSILKDKKFDTSYLAYLLLTKFDNIPLDIRNTIIDLIYKERKNNVFISSLMFEHFDKIPKNILNDYIDSYLTEISSKTPPNNDLTSPEYQNYINKSMSKEIEDTLNEESNITFGNFENNSKVGQTISNLRTTLRPNPKEFYFVASILKHQDKLNLKQKDLLESILYTKNISFANNDFYMCAIDFLEFMEVKQRDKFLENLLNTNDGKSTIINFMIKNKTDIINLVDKTDADFIKRVHNLQEILEKYIVNSLNSDYSKKENLIYFFLSNMLSIEDKYLSNSFKNIIKNTINSADIKKLNNLFSYLSNREEFSSKNSEYIKELLVQRLLKEKEHSYQNIWFS